jgi:hypothetical protein
VKGINFLVWVTQVRDSRLLEVMLLGDLTCVRVLDDVLREELGQLVGLHDSPLSFQAKALLTLQLVQRQPEHPSSLSTQAPQVSQFRHAYPLLPYPI